MGEFSPMNGMFFCHSLDNCPKITFLIRYGLPFRIFGAIITLLKYNCASVVNAGADRRKENGKSL